MMRTRPILRLEEKLDGERALLDALDPGKERTSLVVAGGVAVALIAALATLPIPGAAKTPPGEVAASGSWVTLVRWMPEPHPPEEPTPRMAVAARVVPAPEPISLDIFREPEPIPEPPAAGFRAAPVVREPEPPLGVPEPPPPSAESAISAEPEIETLPPRPAPGGRVSPNYPTAARSLRLSGTVKVEVQVDATGAVTSARVLGTNRPGVGFEDAAARAVERWRFVPATRGSIPVPGSAVVEVVFQW